VVGNQNESALVTVFLAGKTTQHTQIKTKTSKLPHSPIL